MKAAQRPWALVPNKIVRYPGGREIDRFRGITPPVDDGRPEAWVGSDTCTFDAGKSGDPYDGCARCVSPEGEEMYLFEALGRDPGGMLGHAPGMPEREKLGVLVKLLDAQEQLGLQCHPSRPYAKEHFSSDFGKEESWYVIGTRTDSPEPPYVLMGFREGVTRREFEEAYDRQDIRAMEACCHKIPVKTGDVFFISAGLPHAVGCGCFLVEVQEPSDITVGWERLPDSASPQEQEFHKQRLLGCYEYEGSDEKENLRRHQVQPRVIRSGDWGEEKLIIGPEQTSYFSFTQLDARREVPLWQPGTAQVAIVLEGHGVLRCGETDRPIQKGDELFFPFAMDPAWILPEEGERLSVILAKPAGARYPEKET
ncbi:MAG: class I mannose-6-phosphate isomerase [Candidatus Heritagella sp.]